ncbi:MAG: TonB-dependent receptor [Rikenellaceae bacterium]|nr:TonB-dependent receptor [Rikenellaceae bacterium]
MKQKDTRKRTEGLRAFGLLSMLFFVCSGIFAQSRQITGTVRNANSPMAGVAVTVQGTGTGTTTNAQGHYEIMAQPTQTLQFSFLGYDTQSIPVGVRSTIDVEMQESVTNLDEVVVIGYGTVRKRDLTGAVSSIKGDALTLNPVANPIEAMQGRVAGLDIVRNDGRAVSSASIQMRGNRSLGKDSKGDDRTSPPIYIIDGIQGDITTLNPNDIASIDVLKDASSTAIYGSAGANGVIMVTTKQAEKGRTQVDFNAYVSINSNGRYPSALQGNAWLDYLREGYKASYPDVSDPSLEDLLAAWNLDGDLLVPYINNNQWIDYVDEILGTGIQQNYSISVRGGNERTQGYFSLGYNSTKGIYRNDKADLYTMRAGVNHDIAPWIKTGIQTGVAWKDNESRSSRLSYVFQKAPLGEAYDADGNINAYPIEGDVTTVSPLADDVPGAYRNNNKQLSLTMNPYVEFTLARGLTLRSILGTHLSYSRRGEFNSDHTYMMLVGSSAQNRQATYSNTLGYEYTWENIANYHTVIANDHDITATLVSSWGHSQNETSYAYNEGFLYDEFLWYSLTSGTNPGVGSTYSMSKGMSIAGRVSYYYRGKYLFSFSNRTDGTSRLSKRWDSFQSGAVAWRISDEPFMDATRRWLDNLKLRAGYGVSGNSGIEPYSSRTEVTSSGLDAINLGSGKLTTAVLTQTVGNEQLGWEKSYNLNIGLDVTLFQNRVDAAIEWYDTDTKGVLYPRDLAFTNGGFTPKVAYRMTGNLARIKNTGVEVTLTGRPFVNKDFRWETIVTFASNKERVKEIDLGSGETLESELISLGLFIGHPKNTIYGIKKLGIWQKDEAEDAAVFGLLPGDVKSQSNLSKKSNGVWYELNEEGEEVLYTAENPYTIGTNDRRIYGQGTPKWTGGWFNSFQYKNFDLNILTIARWGQTIDAGSLGFFGYGNVTMPDTYNYWTEDNPTNDFPRPYATRATTQYSSPTQSLTTVNGSFVKIKNITLGYSLPLSVNSKLGISNLRVYATMYNPIVIAKSHLLKGTDPETGSGDSFPMYRQVVFGVNFSF